MNHLCASATRCGKSVALLRFEQREHVGPVLCVCVLGGWGSHKRDAGLGGCEGALWAKWDSCFSPCASIPFV